MCKFVFHNMSFLSVDDTVVGLDVLAVKGL